MNYQTPGPSFEKKRENVLQPLLDSLQLGELYHCENGIQITVTRLEREDGLFPSAIEIQIEDTGKVIAFDPDLRISLGEKIRLYFVSCSDRGFVFLSDPQVVTTDGAPMRFQLKLQLHNGKVYSRTLRKRVSGYEPDWKGRMGACRRRIYEATQQASRVHGRHVALFRD